MASSTREITSCEIPPKPFPESSSITPILIPSTPWSKNPEISSGFTDLQGTSSGFSAPSNTVTNIISDAPYSDKNAVSINMQSAKSGSGIDTSTPQAT